jgi:DNA-binding GntR family transcriptional regulator
MHSFARESTENGDQHAEASDGDVRSSDRVFTALMDSILVNRMKPGDMLSEIALAERFGVSRTPVREALQRLKEAGMAERGPRRAFMVRRLDLATLNDLFETLGELEALCAEFSARRMTAAERRELQGIVQEGAACVANADAEAYVGVNKRFHATLFRGAHNASLSDVAQGIRLRTSPYREVQFHRTERLQSSQQEHEAILAAVLAGDGAAARESMRGHVASTAINVSQMLRGI